MGVKGDWIQQFGLIGVVQGRAQSGEGACHYCLLFSVSPVPSCCVCLLHSHLHAQRSCCFIQPYHSKEFIFHTSSLTYSNICAGSCSRHVALGGILISLWKSLLTSSLLVGFCFQRGKQAGTVENPLSSLPPCTKIGPLCVLYRNTEYRTLTRKQVVLALLGCCTSCRPTFHSNGCFCANYSNHLAIAMSLQATRIVLAPSFCVLPPGSVSFSCRLCLVRSTSTGSPDFVSFLMGTSPLIISDMTAAFSASGCSALLVFLAGTLQLSQCPPPESLELIL